MGASRPLLLLAALLLLLPTATLRGEDPPPAPAGTEQSLWEEVFTMDGEGATALYEYQGKLYAGEKDVGAAAKVYVFDGTTWSVALETDDERIMRMAVYQDVLYVAVLHRYDDPQTGAFSGLVRFFDGTTWGVMDQPNAPDRWTQSLYVFQGKLFAGGTSPSGAWIKSWDGQAWATAGTPTSFGGVGHVEDAKNLEVHSDGNLYLVTNYGGYVYRYEGGSTWTEVLDGQDFGGGSCSVKNGAMNAIRSHAGALYAATYCGGTVYRDDGTGWVNLTVMDRGVTGIHDFNGVLYVAVRDGQKDLHRFDGSTWEVAYDEDAFTFMPFATYSPEENLYAGAHNGTVAKVYRRNSVPLPPVADAGPPQLVNEGATVLLDGTGSMDNVGIVNHTWSFDDGTGLVTLYGPTAAHVFPTAGQFPVTLTVWDNAGLADTDSTWVNVTADVTPPADVTNLAVEGTTATTITVSWTAPGDNGDQGTAAEYDLRWATTALDDASWPAAQPATGEPAPSPAGTLETFTLDGLTPGTDYWVGLKTRDEVPNWSGLSNVVTAQTVPPSGAPPTVTFTLPADGETDVPPTANLIVAFSQPMDEPSVHDAFSYTDGSTTWTAADGVMTWSEASEVAQFDPDADLPYGGTYAVTLDASVARDSGGNFLDGDADGAAGGDYAWTFSVAPAPDLDPPTVLDVEPPDGAADVPVDAPVRVRFSEPMDAASVEAALAYRVDGLLQDLAGATLAWDAAGTELTFLPGEPFGYDVTPVFTLSTDATDAAGNALSSPYTWSFTTESGLVTIAGSVVDAHGDAVVGAEVFVDGQTVVTGENGTFLLDDMPPGNHTLAVLATGYEDREVQVMASPGDTFVLNIALTRLTGAAGPVPWLAILAIALALALAGLLVMDRTRRRRDA